MTYRVGAKGQVVIPKELRDALGIEPGDAVTMWREEDHVALRREPSGKVLKGRFAGSGLTDFLESGRRDDGAKESRR